MAKVIAKREPFAERVRNAIREGLALAGMHAQIETEAIPGTKLHRITILAKGFENLRPSERQDLVWRIVAGTFTREEQLLISTIYTFAPTELRG